MSELKNVLWSLAIVLGLLIFLFRGCGSRMEQWREWRNDRQEHREERWDEWQEGRQDRWDKWRDGRQRRWGNRRWFGSFDGRSQICGVSCGALRTQGSTALLAVNVNAASERLTT